MQHWLALAAVGLLALPGTVRAATPFERVRGTIETVDPDAMTIKTTDGTVATVALTKDTKVTAVVRSSLGAITEGSFVGTATKGEPPVALEVHIFPESMRGANEGFREWDMIPDTLAGGGPVKSAMTNGTVRTAEVPKVRSAMTNGTVSAKADSGSDRAGASGDRMLTLTYGSGEKRTVAVTPRTPIVAYELADRSLLRGGAKVFVLVTRDGDKLTALRAAVGKDGLTPPM